MSQHILRGSPKHFGMREKKRHMPLKGEDFFEEKTLQSVIRKHKSKK